MNLIRHGREETGTQCLRRWLETTRIAFPPGRLILHHLHMSDASLLSVRAIDHVAVIARDLEASRHFYEEILGMRSVPRPDFPFPGLWFQAGKTQIHVIFESDEAGTAGPAGFTGTMPARGHHMAFELDDCAVAVDQLQAAGIPIAAGPQSRPDGFRQVYIHDPDGYLVELFSTPPG